MREAPALTLLAELFSAGATVTAYDPAAMNEMRRITGEEPKLSYADTLLAALDNADALIIVTEWKEFRSPDFDGIKHVLKSPVIFDGRNLYDPATVKRHGLEYHCIGRASSVKRIEN
jgi:UDPglucose 6-dehydrogenase